MKKSTKLGLAIAGVIVAGGVVAEIFTHSETGLERVNRAAGFLAASCETHEIEGREWAVCQYEERRNIWAREGDEWIAANDMAMKVVGRLARASADELASLPNVTHRVAGVPEIPAALR